MKQWTALLLAMACGGPEPDPPMQLQPMEIEPPEPVTETPTLVETPTLAIPAAWAEEFPLLGEVLEHPIVEMTEVWSQRRGELTRRLEIHTRPNDREAALTAGQEKLRAVEGGNPRTILTATNIDIGGGTLALRPAAGTDDQLAWTLQSNATRDAMTSRCRELRPTALPLAFDTLPGWPEETTQCISTDSVSGRFGFGNGGAFSVPAESEPAVAWLEGAGFQERANGPAIGQMFSLWTDDLRHSATLRGGTLQVRFKRP
ncbi:MAG: hypothetical protein AAGE52_35090 [Myxococcota bacterium]